MKRQFALEGLTLKIVSISRYLGAFLGPQAELEAWVKPQVEARDHGVYKMKRDLTGSGKYHQSGPLLINSFSNCALCRAKPSKAASSA